MSTDTASTEPARGDLIDDHRWVEPVARVGWIAKAALYSLMGLTAVQIATQDEAGDRASPKGSIGAVADAPFGRILLALLTVGLALYALWRVLSVLETRGGEIDDWAHRVGYGGSAALYVTLAVASGSAAWNGSDPQSSNTVERLSRWALEMPGGRWLLGVAGTATVAVGGYFVVRKGLQRSFCDDLNEVGGRLSSNGSAEKTVLMLGVIGWIGRGIVTALVGLFVARAAITFDPNDAQGFDKSLRELAGSGWGSATVLGCGVLLLAYGAFCFGSYRYRTIDDPI